MARSILSGGGIQSRQYVTSRSGVKVEPEAKAASAAGVAQQGLSTAFKKEPLFEGRGYTPKEMAPTGIANSRFNSAASGPGSGRTIYSSGSQSPTPTARPMPPGRDTLSEYGPDVPGRGRR
jgi:hypothetical protein